MEKEIKKRLEEMQNKIEWEGGMAEVLFHYAGPEFFSIDKDLHRQALLLKELWSDFEDIWKKLLEKHGVEPL